MNNEMLWPIVAWALAVSVALVAALFVLKERTRQKFRWSARDEPGRRIHLPMAVLQLRALLGLVIGTASLIQII